MLGDFVTLGHDGDLVAGDLVTLRTAASAESDSDKSCRHNPAHSLYRLHVGNLRTGVGGGQLVGESECLGALDDVSAHGGRRVVAPSDRADRVVQVRRVQDWERAIRQRRACFGGVPALIGGELACCLVLVQRKRESSKPLS